MQTTAVRAFGPLLWIAAASLAFATQGCIATEDAVVLNIQIAFPIPGPVEGVDITKLGADGTSSGPSGFVVSNLGPGAGIDAERCGGQRGVRYLIVAEPGTPIGVSVDGVAFTGSPTRSVISTQTFMFETQADRWVELPVCLSPVCDGVVCDAGMTCVGGLCESSMVDTAVLLDIPDSEREDLLE